MIATVRGCRALTRLASHCGKVVAAADAVKRGLDDVERFRAGSRSRGYAVPTVADIDDADPDCLRLNGFRVAALTCSRDWMFQNMGIDFSARKAGSNETTRAIEFVLQQDFEIGVRTGATEMSPLNIKVGCARVARGVRQIHVGLDAREMTVISHCGVEVVRTEAEHDCKLRDAFSIEGAAKQVFVRSEEPLRSLQREGLLRPFGSNQRVGIVSHNREVPHADLKVLRIISKQLLHHRLDAPNERRMEVNELDHRYKWCLGAAARTTCYWHRIPLNVPQVLLNDHGMSHERRTSSWRTARLWHTLGGTSKSEPSQQDSNGTNTSLAHNIRSVTHAARAAPRLSSQYGTTGSSSRGRRLRFER
jgi:hypothetical protein